MARRKMTSPSNHEFIIERAYAARSNAQTTPDAGTIATLKVQTSHADLRRMRVEYLDARGQWRPLENATAARVKPGLCEITITESSPAWRARAELLDGSLLRVDGVETNRIIARRTEEDKIIVTATARVSVPEAEADKHEG